MVRAARPKAAFYAFFAVEGMTDSLEMAKRIIDEANVGLAPGSATYYRVGHPSLATSWSAVRRFRTQPPHGAPTTVLLLGDLGVPVNDSSYDTEAQDKGVLNDYPLQTMATIRALGEAERSASALLVGDLSCERSAGKPAAFGFFPR